MKHTGWIVLAAVLFAAFSLAAWTDAASEDANATKHARVAVVNTAGEKVDPATGQTEGAAHASGDGGAMPLFVHLTTRAALAADGKYGPGQLTSNGDLRVRDDDLLTLLGAAGGGAYIRQDSNATIALESGGNLAAAATRLGTSGAAASASGSQAAQLRAIAEGQATAANQATANASLAAAYNRDTAFSAVTVNTWTALADVCLPEHTYLHVVARSETASNTATLIFWGSDDDGTTYGKLLRADTLQPAVGVSIAVGTDVPGTPAGTTYYCDDLMVAIEGCTHIYIEQTAVSTDNFVYEVAGRK